MPPLQIEVLDLVALRRPIAVKLPTGNVVPVAPYDSVGITALRQYEAEQDPKRKGDLLMELLRLALPSAADADLDCTGPEDWTRIIAAAQGKALLVEAVLGNELGAEEEPAPKEEKANEEPPQPGTTDSTTTTTSPPSPPE